MNQKVQVTVDGVPKMFFLGLQVRHAIGWEATSAVEHCRAEVRDAHDNLVGLDGALYDGEDLLVRQIRGPAESGSEEAAGAPAEQMQSRLRRCQERLLEDEAVRSHLTDAEAQPLIDWGLARCAALVTSTVAIADDERANESLREPMRQVMAVMRRISAFVGNRGNLDDAAAMADLDSLFRESAAHPSACTTAARAAIVAGKDTLPKVEMVRQLVALADQVLPATGALVAPETRNGESTA